ncbi:unnamed protein product [Linum trigynum]|uniref:Myb/SANT-like domain-containing protein n=1 Tax=Linum trigynum TaxID=586398 RepID=A0AAV2G186_9ROSI
MTASAWPWTAQRKTTPEGIKSYTPPPGLYKKVFDEVPKSNAEVGIRGCSLSPGVYKKVLDQISGADGKEKGKYFQWTSEMDRCLVRTLIKEIKNGNRKDGVFRAVSYRIAVETINQVFGLDLARDNVKNRLRTLKRLYGILKQLLANEGFEWDKENKMVIAEDLAWNDYLKDHPDARQFRAKVFENYDELCIIFGNEEQELLETWNMICKSVDSIDRAELDSASTSDSQSDDFYDTLSWTKDMDNFLGDFLAEKVRNSSKPVNILCPEIYDILASALKEKFGLVVTDEHIKKRVTSWKKMYDMLKELLSHPGFKWDASRTIVMADDSAWSEYLEICPEASIFRAKVIDNYNQLSLIFDNVSGTTCVVDASNIVDSSKTKEKVNHMWTSEMDRYLGTVLMEQIRAGHKLENKLKPGAYLAATSAMNRRFELRLTKDNVKNRLKIWKKHYNILMEILENDDFEWDEAAKVVVAKNNLAWNHYIERNPEARQFRGRVINNYNELRVIIGHEDPPPFSGDEGAGDAFQSSNDKGSYFVWTEEMDRCLMELLLEQVLLGNKVENNFKTGVYSLALDAINKKFGLELTKNHVRNRLRTLKKQYGLVKELLSHAGFEWDDRLNMVVASDEQWNDYIKENPDARQLRAKPFDNFNMLRCIMEPTPCDNNRPENVANIVLNPTPYQEYHEMELGASPVEDLEGMNHDDNNNGTGDDDDDNLHNSSSSTQSRPPSSQNLKKRRRRANADDVMIDIMSVIATNVGKIADALAAEKTNSVDLDELFEMIRVIPEFDDDLVIDACEYLSCDDKKAKMFMKLDDRLRRKWLLKRLRSGDGGENSN